MLLKETIKVTGLSKKAIQYYENKGLVAQKKLKNGYHDYDEACILQLKKIKHMRALHMSMVQIQMILQGKAEPCNVYGEQLKEVERSITLLLQQNSSLEELIKGSDLMEIDVQVVKAFVYTTHIPALMVIIEVLLGMIGILCFELIPAMDSIWPLFGILLLGSAVFYYVYLAGKTTNNWERMEFSTRDLILILVFEAINQFLIMSMLQFANEMMKWYWVILLWCLLELFVLWHDKNWFIAFNNKETI